MSQATGKVLWGVTCFAEYRPCLEPDAFTQQWQVKKYANDWSFSLDREEDVVVLMAKLDALAFDPLGMKR